jgi:hypothetical protein
MLASVAVVASILSLLSCTSALTLNVNARQTDCVLPCPDTDVDGNGLSTFTSDGTTVSCSYSGDSDNSCSYDFVSVDSPRISHTQAHTSRFRPPVLSSIIPMAALSRPYNSALIVEADS